MSRKTQHAQRNTSRVLLYLLVINILAVVLSEHLLAFGRGVADCRAAFLTANGTEAQRAADDVHDRAPAKHDEQQYDYDDEVLHAC